MEARHGGTDVIERSCAMARGREGDAGACYTESNIDEEEKEEKEAGNEKGREERGGENQRGEEDGGRDSESEQEWR